MDIRTLLSTIANRRKQLGLTQIDLARRAGVSRRTIISLEAGQTDIGILRLARIVDVMDLAIAFAPRASRPTESQLSEIFKDDDEYA